MFLKFQLLLVFNLLIAFQSVAQFTTQPVKTNAEIVDIDHLLDSLNNSTQTLRIETSIPKSVATIKYEIDTILNKKKMHQLDSTVIEGNFLLLPIILRSKPYTFDFKQALVPFQVLNKTNENRNFESTTLIMNQFQFYEQVQTVRLKALMYMSSHAPSLIAYYEKHLPSTSGIKTTLIDGRNLENIRLINDNQEQPRTRNNLRVDKIQVRPWQYKADAYLQFSQGLVSKNWHQGGTNNLSILGTVNGRINYDNKKNIQWENFAEWRTGFNSIEGDTLRFLSTNDDIVRAFSKLGVKATGRLFYSSLFEFSMPLFSTFRAMNSRDLKAAFLTPVRMNISVGFDYKYKKELSIMFSPISYKYIYLNNPRVNPRQFGINTGENTLKELGSQLRIMANKNFTDQISMNTRFSFYTNYNKVEIDWEIVGNFRVNRFLSTRLLLNPRFDNSVILPGGEKAKLQFKQILTFGLAYKLLD